MNQTKWKLPPVVPPLVGLTCVAVAYVAKSLLIPTALAILLAFILFPLVRRLGRLGLPHLLSCILITLFTAAAGVGAIFLVSSQLVQLTNRIPDYRANFNEKILSLRPNPTGSMAKLRRTVNELQREIAVTAAGPTTQAAADKPVPVEVVNNQPDALGTALGIIGPVVYPLTDAGVVFVLVFFLLLEGSQMAGRSLELANRSHLHISRESVEEAASRMSRYLMAQLTINAVYGGLIALALYALGLPNWLLWGFLTALLRYVPYVGAWIAAVLPFVLSMAVFPGWTRPLLVLTAFAGCEIVTSWVMEPLMFGSSTGVSPLGVVFSILFWSWLWGPVGLILAMPMTVTMIVLGRQIPGLMGISFLLSNSRERKEPLARRFLRILRVLRTRLVHSRKIVTNTLHITAGRSL